MVGKNILIVDDEAPIREMIAVALEMAGYDCLEAENTQQAHALIVDRKPDLILLDWMLPGTSGIELARRLKRDELTDDIPIIMLTAKGEEDNKIQGLEVGADDYITKPFSPRELVARLKAVLRRAGAADSETPIEVGGLLLDPISHRVTIDGKPADMGPTEYRLLQFFMTHQERAYTRGQLLDQVWVSEELVGGAKFALGDVRRIEVFNDHLHEGRDRTRSDHGFVRALLRLRPVPPVTSDDNNGKVTG